jgi:predicted glycosyltransferase
MRDFKPKVKYDYKRPLIIVRELETKAVYAERKKNLTRILAKKLTSLGNVLFLPRYKRQPEKGLIVPREFVDSASLVSQADLVVSVGGTIAREAALQGVPTIVVRLFGRLHVNDYLSKRGFPIFSVSPDEVFDYGRRLLGERWDVRNLLESLENPVDVIERVIKEEIRQ